ncbi:MAG: phytase, partial [Proteobacteria bacterium]|nr:phytase [Pseudomonadota bacterium]
MRILLSLLSLLSLPLSAQIPVLEAQVETDPIPAGFSHSDDAAVWKHLQDPNKSLVLGTSKYSKNGMGGLGVYDLDGHQLQFFAGSKLNSVDVLQNLAIASNRSENALDIYRIDEGKLSFMTRTALLDDKGASFEPYGLCLSPGLSQSVNIFLPTKSGILYHYVLDANYQSHLHAALDLARLVTLEQDDFIKNIVTKAAKAEGEEDELQEHLDQRFILEGCAFDQVTQKLYVGMENFGIWSIDTSTAFASPEPVIRVQGSWTDIETWQDGRPRVTDDIEGMDVLHANGRSYLLFSSQGISEFTLYDLSDLSWRGNFKISFGMDDAITATDGLAIKVGNLGPRFPEGVLVVHDDSNTQPDGAKAAANYKLLSLADLWR